MQIEIRSLNDPHRILLHPADFIGLESDLVMVVMGLDDGHMGAGMMGSGRQQGDRTYWNTDRYEREYRARQQFEEDTRSLRRDIDETQKALDRELDRSNPDVPKVKRLHKELGYLQDKLEYEQRRYDQFRQEEAGRYDDRDYPRNW